MMIRIAVIARGDPGADGGAAIRMRSTIESLDAFGAVDVYVLSHDPPSPSSAARINREIEWIPMQQRRVLPQDYLLSLCGMRPRRISASRLGKQRRVVAEHVPVDYELYWAYTDRAFLSLPRRHRRRVVITDLVDFEDARDLALARIRPTHFRGLKQLLARADARALRRLLHSIARQSSATVLSSPDDVLRLGSGHVSLLENSYPRPTSDERPTPSGGPPTYVFVGLMTYEPNVDAVRWLVSEVWPIVRAAQPDARLRIVGRGLAADEFSGADGVEVVGWVRDIAAELATASASVVPLRIGSGTRLKVIEGWAHRVPVISTTVGAEGLSASDGVNLLIADDRQAFAAAMLRVSTDLTLRQHLVEAAHQHWAELYSHDAAAAAVRAIVETTLGTGGAGATLGIM